MPTPTAFTARIRWAAGWRGGARIVKVRCPYCRTMRAARHFRIIGAGCRRCVGNG